MYWLRKLHKKTSLVLSGALLVSLLPSAAGEAAQESFVNPNIQNQQAATIIQGQNKVLPELVKSNEGVAERKYIIRFKNKPEKSLIQKGRGKVKRELRHLSAISVSMPVTEVEKLKNNPLIQSIEEDVQLQIAEQTMEWGVNVLDATYAWNQGFTGKGVKVAVLDTGIDQGHEDLVVAGGASLVDYTSSFDDDNGHGTHVAGIIGAKNNDVGIAGVAPDSSLYAVKVLDGSGKGYLSDVIAGIDWGISNGVDIINLSMATPVDSPALREAVEKADANGVVVVAAAGNTGNAEGTGDSVQYPAKYSSVLSVGAVSGDLHRAPFSATGLQLSLVAPGVGIRSTGLHNTYEVKTGTSMAAGFVTGQLALLKETQLGQSETRPLKEEVIRYTKDLGDIGRDAQYGYGLVTLQKASPNTYDDVTVVDDTYKPTTVTDNVYLYSAAGMSMAYYPEYYIHSIRGDALAATFDGNQREVVWMFGGINGNTTYGYRAATWDTSTSTGAKAGYISLAGNQTSIAPGTALTLENGNILIGETAGHRHLFDPIRKTLTLNHTYAPTSVMTRLLNGQIFSVGGIVDKTVPSVSYMYDSQNNTWTRKADLPKPVSANSISTLHDGRVILFGSIQEGVWYRSKLFFYDPNNNTWTEGDYVPNDIDSTTQETLKDGRVAFFGGYSETEGKILDTITLYNPTNNTWSTSPLKFNEPLYGVGTTVLSDGRVLVRGGCSSFNTTCEKDLYLFKFNALPKVSVNHVNQLIYAQTGDPTITLSGRTSDFDNENVTVSATIAGVTRSIAISNTGSEQNWQLQWNAKNDNIPQGVHTNIVISVTDGTETNTVNYTGTITVDHNRPPLSPTIVSPAAGSASAPTVISAEGVKLSWSVSDPEGDMQSAYHLVINNAANGALVTDTEWVNSSITSHTIPSGVLTTGNVYQWKVEVRDAKGGVSPYSSAGYLRVNRPPVPAVTSYTDGQQLTDNILTLTWTYSDPDGQAQTSYQVLGSKDNWSTIGYTSGVIDSAATSHTTTQLADGTWSFAVLVKDGMEWSQRAYRSNLKLPNTFEPNNTFDAAFPLITNVPFQSTVNASGDLDYYKYTATKTGIDEFTLTMPADKNYDVVIYDDIRYIVVSGLRGKGREENLLYRVEEGKTYYIRVSGSTSSDYSATATYTGKLSPVNFYSFTRYEYDANGNIQSKKSTSVRPANAESDFSEIQGKNNWYYQEWNGTSYVDMTWDPSNQRWKGAGQYSLNMKDGLHPEGTDAVRKWVAPTDGRVQITGRVFKGSLTGGDGVQVRILKNTVKIWPAGAEWQDIAFNDGIGAQVDTSIDVKAGDALYFIVNQKSNNGYDTTRWSPTITYMN
ncbi:subtilisin family serine protease/N-acetylneuraminic acid mutarotase [Paenibacillus mucilaginosus]|uniref:S8 family serine peptidase n=1 Tax=Paenibacillus mucilaginosus TaxID=61624 RepID=UPI003D1A9CA2